jgi:hypothetical protein
VTLGESLKGKATTVIYATITVIPASKGVTGLPISLVVGQGLSHKNRRIDWVCLRSLLDK